MLFFPILFQVPALQLCKFFTYYKISLRQIQIFYFYLSLFAVLLTPNSMDNCWHFGFYSPLPSAANKINLCSIIPPYNAIYMGYEIGLQQSISVGRLQVQQTSFFITGVKCISYFPKCFTGLLLGKNWRNTEPYTIKGSLHRLLEKFLFVRSLGGLS